ncbi:unnamed protein product [Notodromas monacha]|uniref:Uncharacterized protein n=1 Tax=Notodromas monacha TaxID=399045 RepID=A0A7R9BFN6_9CRUS|nr:unnamed protein product [Notodromas monacha]CAG0914561.1 unnamed protein product [Notodromas monacha]
MADTCSVNTQASAPMPTDGRGDQPVAEEQSLEENVDRPHKMVYHDRDFLLYFKESPYCKTFHSNLFTDLTMGIIKRHPNDRVCMTRTEIEHTTKKVIELLTYENADGCARRLNEMKLGGPNDVNIVTGLVYEKVVDDPRLASRLAMNLSSNLFCNLIRQCSMEMDIDRGFDDLRRSLINNSDSQEMREENRNALKDLQAKETSMKQRLIATAVFVSELYELGAPVKVKTIFMCIYKLANLWSSKHEAVFMETLIHVVGKCLAKLCDRGNNYRVLALLRELETVAQSPSVPQHLRVELMNAMMRISTSMQFASVQPGIPQCLPANTLNIGCPLPINPPPVRLGALPTPPFAGPPPRNSNFRPPLIQTQPKFLWYRPPIPYVNSFVPPTPPNYCQLIPPQLRMRNPGPNNDKPRDREKFLSKDCSSGEEESKSEDNDSGRRNSV